MAHTTTTTTATHRRCSLAIESPSEYPSNNPLNAFLVYSHSPTQSQQQDDSPPPLITPPIQSQEFSYFSLHKHNNEQMMDNDNDNDDSDDLSSLQSIHKSNSLPNLSPSPSFIISSPSSTISAPILGVTSPLNPFKRRVSLCDLNNFNDELKIINNNNSRKNSINSINSNNSGNIGLNPNRMFLKNHHTNNYFQNVDFSNQSSSNNNHNKICRNHHRRNSIAIKFENPKIID
ncbi:hypothetical protein DFJ63DRAFT_337882 [Scheffersomyces coipomensis]|uniref:uncharacterized protein n=1 Tax=Scheffersomyces coipomensis TaxID=1788519 RepID=UPI00315D7D0B